MTTRVFLVRHGQTEWNAQRRYQGRSDSPLTPLGQDQMRRLAAALAQEPVAAVYTSPLGRCWWGAECIAAVHGLEPIPEPDLVELNHGILDGLRVEEMEAEVGELVRRWWRDPARVRLPGGETLEEARTRAMRAFGRIVAGHPDGTVVVVSHAGINRLILLTLLDAPLSAYFRLQQHNGAINLIEASSPEEARIVTLNDTCYLKLPTQDPGLIGQE
jgi:broad specificity phosphatase PhoE